MEKISFLDFGTIASILSLIITILIFINLRKIKNFYIFKIRSPYLSKKLKDITSNISNFLNDYESSIYLIDEEVAKFEVTLKSLKRKISGTTKKSAKYLIKKLSDYQNSPNEKTEQNLRIIYVDALKIIEEIKELQEDYKWGR